MKYAMSAAVALALSFGLAASAQAWGPRASSNYTGPNAAMERATAQPQIGAQAENVSPQMVKQAQRSLKSEGFYHGRIDGIVGPQTRQAIAQFQEKNDLSRTARLDQETLMRLSGEGVGSSMPNSFNRGPAQQLNAPNYQAPNAAGEGGVGYGARPNQNINNR